MVLVGERNRKPTKARRTYRRYTKRGPIDTRKDQSRLVVVKIDHHRIDISSTCFDPVPTDGLRRNTRPSVLRWERNSAVLPFNCIRLDVDGTVYCVDEDAMLTFAVRIDVPTQFSESRLVLSPDIRLDPTTNLRLRSTPLEVPRRIITPFHIKVARSTRLST